MKKRIIALVMMLAVLCPNILVASARYSDFDYLYTEFSISSLGVAKISGDASCSNANTVTMTASLQQQQGTKWVEIDSYMDYGTRSAVISKSIAVYKGYTYRVVFTSKAFNGSTTLEIVEDTKTVKY